MQGNVEYVAVRAGKDESATPAKLVQNYVVCELDKKLDVLLGFIKTHLKSKMIAFFSSCAQVGETSSSPPNDDGASIGDTIPYRLDATEIVFQLLMGTAPPNMFWLSVCQFLRWISCIARHSGRCDSCMSFYVPCSQALLSWPFMASASIPAGRRSTWIFCANREQSFLRLTSLQEGSISRLLIGLYRSREMSDRHMSVAGNETLNSKA